MATIINQHRAIQGDTYFLKTDQKVKRKLSGIKCDHDNVERSVKQTP